MSIEFSSNYTWTTTYRVRNGDAKVDLSGCKVLFEILNRKGETVFSVGSETGHIKTEPLDGDIHLRVDAKDRDSLKPGTYLSRIVIIWPDGTKQPTDLEPTTILKA